MISITLFHSDAMMEAERILKLAMDNEHTGNKYGSGNWEVIACMVHLLQTEKYSSIKDRVQFVRHNVPHSDILITLDEMKIAIEHDIEMRPI